MPEHSEAAEAAYPIPFGQGDPYRATSALRTAFDRGRESVLAERQTVTREALAEELGKLFYFSGTQINFIREAAALLTADIFEDKATVQAEALEAAANRNPCSCTTCRGWLRDRAAAIRAQPTEGTDQ